MFPSENTKASILLSTFVPNGHHLILLLLFYSKLLEITISTFLFLLYCLSPTLQSSLIWSPCLSNISSIQPNGKFTQPQIWPSRVRLNLCHLGQRSLPQQQHVGGLPPSLALSFTGRCLRLDTPAMLNPGGSQHTWHLFSFRSFCPSSLLSLGHSTQTLMLMNVSHVGPNPNTFLLTLPRKLMNLSTWFPQ